MLIQAHRGNSGQAPENTLAAFKSAIQAKADGIECDIHVTKDGHFVVCHDETIDRTSTGTGIIADMAFEDLRKYDFGVKFGEEFKGEKIPELKEMLEIVKDMRVINIEIKEFGENILGDVYKNLLELLYDFNIIDKVIISSFQVEALRKIYALDNNLYTAFLCEIKNSLNNDIKNNIKIAQDLNCKAIHPEFRSLTPEFMTMAKSANLAVNAWTANGNDDILFCKNLGCDAVITNEPKLARELV